MTARTYLDWNATAPLRPEARDAMLAAMDVVGNPSSVHAEGRAARAIVENARGQVAALVDCEPSEVVFTSGATEAAHAFFRLPFGSCWMAAEFEHDAVFGASLNFGGWVNHQRLGEKGCPAPTAFSDDFRHPSARPGRSHVCSAANGETGLVPDWRGIAAVSDALGAVWFSDATQVSGKLPVAELRADFMAMSAHKLGGPKGVGALVARREIEAGHALLRGNHERRRRAGTENVIGIAGFGAAAETARRDLEAGIWERVEKLRDDMEQALVSAAPDVIIFGKDAPRLPNTSCFAIPGWKGETQVMQMDLAGFAVSAGSACSSGKVGPSRVLKAMGFDDVTASSAIRVSIGPTTTEAEVMAFVETWKEFYQRRRVAA